MQPLDAGCFKTEKHWHAKAIAYTLDNLDFDYSIAPFLRDLPEIRAKTFQKTTIRDAFRHISMCNVGHWQSMRFLLALYRRFYSIL